MAKKKTTREEAAITPAPQSAPASQPPKQASPAFGPGGIQIETMEQAWNFAKVYVRSGLAPKGFESPEAVIIAMQLGAEMGLKPLAALQSIAVINGRPSIWGDGMLAVCRQSGLFDEENFVESIQLDPNNGELIATCSCRRLPNGQIITREYALSDAKQAGLLDKKGPWSQYTKRMLQMRARSWALRDGFTDVLRGLISAEEAQGIRAPVVDRTPAPRVKQVDQLDEITARLESRRDEVENAEDAGAGELDPEFQLQQQTE